MAGILSSPGCFFIFSNRLSFIIVVYCDSGIGNLTKGLTYATQGFCH